MGYLIERDCLDFGWRQQIDMMRAVMEEMIAWRYFDILCTGATCLFNEALVSFVPIL